MATSKMTKRKVTFTLEAPDAETVVLQGDFSDWEQQPVSLKRLKSGQWKATVALDEGSYEYRYIVDGKWVDDPQCHLRVHNPFGSHNCVRVVS